MFSSPALIDMARHIINWIRCKLARLVSNEFVELGAIFFKLNRNRPGQRQFHQSLESKHAVERFLSERCPLTCAEGRIDISYSNGILEAVVQSIKRCPSKRPTNFNELD